MTQGLILNYRDYAPTLGGALTLAEDGALIGRSTIGGGSSFGAYATVRGDGESIRVGANGWFGQHATVHIADQIRGAAIGNDVTVARYGLVHACTLDDGVVVGESSVVMDDAHVGAYAVIAADSVVPPRKDLPGGFLYSGHPAKPIRPITVAEARDIAADVQRGRPAEVIVSKHLPTWDLVVDPLRALPGGSLRTLHGRSPGIIDAYVAPTAIVAGAVEMREDSSVFFGCAVCAGDARVVIGARTNVQDNCILATDAKRGDLILGEGITIGHNVQMGSGTVGDDSLIGMGSRVGDHVIVERGACIGAGAYVEPGTVVPAGWIWAGRPARAFRELKPEERKEFARARDIYVTYSADYRKRA